MEPLLLVALAKTWIERTARVAALDREDAELQGKRREAAENLQSTRSSLYDLVNVHSRLRVIEVEHETGRAILVQLNSCDVNVIEEFTIEREP